MCPDVVLGSQENNENPLSGYTLTKSRCNRVLHKYPAISLGGQRRRLRRADNHVTFMC